MAQKRNSHDALFRAADAAARTFRRHKAGELRQNARMAQQQKNWPLSESLWRQSLEADPGDRAAIIGLANALVYIDKFDEARALAETLLAQWPEDENGPLLLARLAEARGDNVAAIAQWRRVLALNPGKIQALIRLGRLLVVEADFAAARECAARLTAVAPDNPAAGTLLAEIAAAQGDLAGALAHHKALAGRLPQNGLVLRDYGRALLAVRDFEPCAALIERLKNVDRQNGLWLEGLYLAETQPEASHTAFWKEANAAFPRNAEFVRKYLHAALRDADRDEALAAMAVLFATPPLRESDANFVIGLANLLDSARGGETIRRVVRDFFKGLRDSAAYRLAAIRLSRIVFEHFPNAGRLPGRASTQRLLRMLRRAPVHPDARAVIEAAAAREIELQKTSAQCLFDTDISRAEAQAFVADIRTRLSAGTPTSFIRVGDGEANALTYESELERHAPADAVEREIVWWGRALEPRDRARLGARVLAAMKEADILGIPTLARVLRDIRLEQPQNLARTRPGRGLRAALRALEEDGELHGTQAAMLTSAHLQHDLQKWDLYRELFAGLDNIVAVSCHPNLADVFQGLFEAQIVHNIVVPPRHASLAAFGLSQMGPSILPEVLDQVVAQLGDDLSGRLVIVGAGYAGKCIVREARVRGAVALDLGSILDYWMGAATRSYLTAASPSRG